MREWKTGDRCRVKMATYKGDGTVRLVYPSGIVEVLCEDGVTRNPWPRQMRRVDDAAPATEAADPLLCPRCSTPSHPVAMRTRGEVRVHFWQCGCPVRPDVVEAAWTMPGSAALTVGTPTHAASDRVMFAQGHGAMGRHPTEAGAIAAWRVALERRQREEDEAWLVELTPASLRMYATLAAPSREASAASITSCFSVAAVMGARMLARERESLATLPTRTDDEVRQVAAACTEATHVETLVAVANECARRWPAMRRAEFGCDDVVLSVAEGRWIKIAREGCTGVKAYRLGPLPVADVIKRLAGVPW